MNPCILAYIPPPSFGNGEAFLKNLRFWKTKIPIITYSDHPGWGADILVPNPETARRPRRHWLVNNFVFLMGLQIARQHGYTHFIYLEEDCRVRGDGWAEFVISEFSKWPRAIMGGTPTAWNPMNGGVDTLKDFINYAHDYQRRSGVPIPIYGASIPKAPQYAKFCVYPNGAAAIYETRWLLDAFHISGVGIATTAISGDAYDMIIGWEMFRQFGVGVFSKVAPLSSVFSGFGDQIMDYQQRVDSLVSGKFKVVHQIKSQDSLTL